MNQYPPPPNDPASPYPAQPPVSSPEPPRAVRVALPSSAPYVTYGILGVTVAVYLLQLLSINLLGRPVAGADIDWLEFYGACMKGAILSGELWRLVTPVLLHASIPHIFFNMYALYAFGVGLERSYGHGRFLLLYLLAGFAGNVFSFLHLPLDIGLPVAPYSVGASTAIFGLIAAEGVFLYQNRKLLGSQFRSAIGNIIFIVVVNMVIGLAPGIDLWGHIGGLIGGLIFAWFGGPVWDVQGFMPSYYVVDKREPRDIISGAAIVIVVFGALVAWGMSSTLFR